MARKAKKKLYKCGKLRLSLSTIAALPEIRALGLTYSHLYARLEQLGWEEREAFTVPMGHARSGAPRMRAKIGTRVVELERRVDDLFSDLAKMTIATLDLQALVAQLQKRK